ncbi:hypothetical protein H0I76_10530 [Limibaculum sp. M0105]|uniref:Uncharacterized protein n=1 Tax=Thermohalobaculum xanthum TaxID=2753746 RepID=A0A8J7M777_9RHOB|nr:hypothetical protein [Thermohalobaculum xanthum]MBK0399629.1 hypothetical protein [Thermohalobaculum xanthum]
MMCKAVPATRSRCARRTSWRRVARTAAAFVIVGSLASPDAQADTLQYDPDLCPTEADGKVYLRLATGIAFGFPSGSLQYLYDTFEPRPEAPDPSAPEGCPGNPIVTKTATVAFSFEIPPKVESAEPRRIAEFVKLRGADALAFRPGTDHLFLQNSVFHLSEVSRKLGRCEETPKGWEVCYQPKPGRPHHTDNGAYYIALPDRHPLRSGIPLAARCSPPLPWNGKRLCDLDYRPLPRVYLSLAFTDKEIPIEYLFAFDAAVVDWLESSHVPELDFIPPPGVLYMEAGQ